MALFMVSYDLLSPARDYTTLQKRLADWKATRLLLSQWLIQWDTSSKAIRDDLVKYVDANDRVLVVKLTGEAAWRAKGLLTPDDHALALFQGNRL